MNRQLSVFLAGLAFTGVSMASTILLPSSPLTVSSNGTLASFTYTGTLTQNDTISFTASGTPCLQPGPSYCTNAAGILTTGTPGSTNTFSGIFGGTSGTWNFGQLVMIISAVGATDPFLPSASNGLGSSTPPTSLFLSVSTLGSLGFGTFSVVNPTISFTVADNNYVDNTGIFSLSQSTVPEPASITLMGLGLVAAGFLRRRVIR